MPQKPVHEQEQDEEPQSVPQTIHENSQEVLEGAQQEVQAAKALWYLTLKRGRLLLVLYALQLALFGIVACWVHANPVLLFDVVITRDFQGNKTPWLKEVRIAVSLPGV